MSKLTINNILDYQNYWARDFTGTYIKNIYKFKKDKSDNICGCILNMSLDKF